MVGNTRSRLLFFAVALLMSRTLCLADEQESGDSVESAFKGLLEGFVNELAREAHDRVVEVGQGAGEAVSGNESERRGTTQTWVYQATHLGAFPMPATTVSIAGSWKLTTPNNRPGQNSAKPGYIWVSQGNGPGHWSRRKAGGWKFSQSGTQISFARDGTCEQGVVRQLRGRLRVEWSIGRAPARSCLLGYDAGTAIARIEQQADGSRRMIWEDVVLVVNGEEQKSPDWAFAGSAASPLDLQRTAGEMQ